MKAKSYLLMTANVFSENRLMKFFIAVLLASNIALAWLMFMQVREQKTVLILPGNAKGITIGAYDADAEYINMFSRYVADLFLSYTPYNARGQFEEILKLVHPRTFNETKNLLYDLADKINTTKANGQFFIDGMTVNEAGDGSKYVVVTGLKRQHINDVQSPDERKAYRIEYTIEHGRFFLLGISEQSLLN